MVAGDLTPLAFRVCSFCLRSIPGVFSGLIPASDLSPVPSKYAPGCPWPRISTSTSSIDPNAGPTAARPSPVASPS